jgi:hypothetical protein
MLKVGPALPFACGEGSSPISRRDASVCRHAACPVAARFNPSYVSLWFGRRVAAGDEAARDGEYAVLSEEVAGQGLRFPRIRRWHRNQDDEWFITHTIESIEAP